MFDLSSCRFLDEAEHFAPRDGHRFVEIWSEGAERKPAICQGELRERDVVAWALEERKPDGCHDSRSQNGRLRVLLCPKAGGRLSSRNLPLSRYAYRVLADAWRIPPSFLRAVCQQLSIVYRCRAKEPLEVDLDDTKTEKHDDESIEASDAVLEETTCLVIRGDVDWTWDYSLVVIHDPKTGTTRAVCTGLTTTEIHLITSYLENCQELAHHPLLLPIILLDLAVDDMSALIKLRLKLLNDIQQETGMDRFSCIQGPGKRDRTALDLDRIMLHLTCLSNWVAAHSSFAKTQGRLLCMVEDLLRKESDGIAYDQDQSAIVVLRQFQERLVFVDQTLKAAEQKLEYLERSIDAQVQTVYSLIAQKDNRLNIAAADASRQIADDSRRVAILTRRDSTDMRIIAAVTLVFLPGTFVATFFSTGFFEFPDGSSNESNNGSGNASRDLTMSPYIWIYFAISAVLTLIVLAGWYVASYFQGRRMLVEFGVDCTMRSPACSTEALEKRDTGTTLVPRPKSWLAQWKGFRRKKSRDFALGM